MRIAVLVMTAVMVSLTGCQSQPKPAQKVEKPAPIVGQDVTFIITQNAKKSWVLHADKATYSPDQRLANLVTVKGQTFSPEGKPMAEFTAPAGRYDQVSKHITLFNGVTAKSISDKPVVLNAPTIVWKSSAPEALATGGVVIQNPGFGESHASQCRFSLDFTHIALEGNASTTVK